MSQEVWYADTLSDANRRTIEKEANINAEREANLRNSVPILEALIRVGHQPTTLLQELNQGIKYMELQTPYSRSVGEMTENDIRHLQYNWGEAHGMEEMRKETILKICAMPRWTLASPFITDEQLCLHGFEVSQQYVIVVEITKNGQKYRVAIDNNKKPGIEIEERVGLFGMTRKIVEIPVPRLEERVTWKETVSLNSEELKSLLVEAAIKPPLKEIFHRVPWEMRAEFGLGADHGGWSVGSWGGWSGV